MAYRIKRRKKNPESGASTILLLGGVAVAGYLAYTNGLFNSLLGTAPATTTTASSQPVTPTAASVASVPALGTVVSTNANLALQVGAKLPYILPADAIMGQSPAGYVLATDAIASETGSTSGQIYVRTDIATALMGVINALGAVGNAAATAAGGPLVYVPATLATLYQYPFQGLSQLQAVMKTANLSGMGFVQARNIFPYNPITAASVGWKGYN